MTAHLKYLHDPRQGSGTWDANAVAAGNSTPAGLTLIGGDSLGDWTLYAVRQQQDATGTVPNFVNLSVQVGHQSVAVNANVLPNLFLSAQTLQTWLVYHAVCSELRCDIVVQGNGLGTKPSSDRVVAWIAPGRPSHLQINQWLLANVKNLIPTFAVSLELFHNVDLNDFLVWYDVAGNIAHTTQLTTSADRAGYKVAYDKIRAGLEQGRDPRGGDAADVRAASSLERTRVGGRRCSRSDFLSLAPRECAIHGPTHDLNTHAIRRAARCVRAARESTAVSTSSHRAARRS